MSIINIAILVIAIAFSATAGWKAALRWNTKTRDARKEDPRDQEIRELTAALSVARKEVSVLDNSSNSQGSQIGGLQERLDKAIAALTDHQQKYNATKEALNREIELKERLDSEMSQLHKDLEAARSTAAEYEVAAKISTPSSGLIAGLDDGLEDDEKEIYTIRHEHTILKQRNAELTAEASTVQAEADRWKKHCTVMTQTNRTLRAQVDSLEAANSELDDLRNKAEQLVTANAEIAAMQAEVAKLEPLRAKQKDLQGQVDELLAAQTNTLAVNKALEQQVAELEPLRAIGQDLQSQVAQLQAAQERSLASNASLEKQVAELAPLRAVQTSLQSQVDELLAAQERTLASNKALEQLVAELEPLQASHKDLQSQQTKLQAAHEGALASNTALEQLVAELAPLEKEVSQLRNKAAALLQAEEDNAKLTAELAQLTTVKQENEHLQGRLDAYAKIDAENQKLLAEIKNLRRSSATELEQAALDKAELQARVAAIDAIQSENNELIARCKELQHKANSADDLAALVATLSTADIDNGELRKKITQLEQESSTLRQKHSNLQDEHQQQSKANNELGARIEKLTRSVKDNEQLRRQLDELQTEQGMNEKMRAEIDQFRAACERANTEIEQLKLELAETAQLQNAINQLQSTADELAQENKTLTSNLQERDAQYRAESAGLQAELDKLRTQLHEGEKLRTQVQSLNAEQTELEKRYNHSAHSLETERNETQKLREQLERLTERVKASKSAIAHDNVTSSKKSVTTSDDADTDAETDDSEHTDTLPTITKDAVPDDLKSIKGVGAKIEHKLYMLCVVNFRGLAKLNRRDYERAAQLIPNLEGRMQRDGWADQARALHRAKYHEDI